MLVPRSIVTDISDGVLNVAVPDEARYVASALVVAVTVPLPRAGTVTVATPDVFVVALRVVVAPAWVTATDTAAFGRCGARTVIVRFLP